MLSTNFFGFYEMVKFSNNENKQMSILSYFNSNEIKLIQVIKNIKINKYKYNNLVNTKINKLNCVFAINEFICCLLYVDAEINIKLIKLLIKLGFLDSEWYYMQATVSDDIRIFKLMIKLGFRDYNWFLENAILNGKLKYIKYSMKLGATNLNSSRYALRNTSIKLVKSLLKLGGIEYEQYLCAAAVSGDIRSVKLMLQKGAKNYNLCTWKALNAGNLKIVKMMFKLGVDKNILFTHIINFEDIEFKYINIIKLCIKLGYNIYDIDILKY